MTAKKSKPPVLPKERMEADDAPYGMSKKYNWRVSGGDFVTEMLDKHGLPLGEPVLPKKKKKDK